jgi:uncharacterized surface protein with fasciclin (FAS1) repeats
MLKTMRSVAVAALALPVLLGGCESTTTPEPRLNIVATAQAAGTFNVLLAAAEAAGLAGTLANDGPFTVFAPTDAAFAALPAGTVESLLANPEMLRAVLTYHVVAGRVSSTQAAQLSSAQTLNGGAVAIMSSGGGLMVNDARVIQADVEASNGVIHVIDAVLIP